MSQIFKQMGSGALQIVVLVFALIVGLFVWNKYKGTPSQSIDAGSGQGTGNSGFNDQTFQDWTQKQNQFDTDLLTKLGQITNNQQVITDQTKATRDASQTAASRSTDNIVSQNQQNTTTSTDAEVSAAVAKAASGGTFNFHDATFRRALNDRITKMGGQVGVYVTGQKVAANWAANVNAGPNVSAGSTPASIATPSLKRPGGASVSDQNAAVQSMLDNIAKQGYVLQKAKPTGYGTGLG